VLYSLRRGEARMVNHAAAFRHLADRVNGNLRSGHRAIRFQRRARHRFDAEGRRARTLDHTAKENRPLVLPAMRSADPGTRRPPDAPKISPKEPNERSSH